jgi:hypothetical protein
MTQKAVKSGCMRVWTGLFCACLFLALACPATVYQTQADQLYYWKDKDGNIQISDIPPESPADRGKMKSINDPGETGAMPQEGSRQDSRQKAPPSKQPPAYSQKEVTIYTNST